MNAETVKKLVHRAMGVGGDPPDPSAGATLLELVERAEQTGDDSLFAEMAKPGANDILYWAVDQGHVGVVKSLLKGGINPTLGQTGLRPINAAAAAGRKEIIEILIQAGESACYAGHNGTPVVIVAAEAGHCESVKALVRLGADVNARAQSGGQTVLIALSPKADAAGVRQIMKKGADINAADDEGLTALMRAAAGGNVEGVNELIRLGADVNQASRLRSVEAMEAEGRGGIFSGKALRRMRAARTDPLGTALMLAAQNGHAEVAELLMKAGADVTACEAKGRTAIEFAEANGHATVLRILRGGSLIGPPEIGIRDLLRAAQEGNLAQIQATLRAGVDVNGKIAVSYAGNINDGLTPSGGKPALVLAAERGDLAIVNALLAAGADPNLPAETTLFDNGQNALHAAAERGHVGVLQALIGAGAKPKAKEAGRPNIPGRTPLQLASAGGHRQAVEELLKAIQHSARDSGKGPAGLHEAASAGNEELVALLLNQGADLETLSRKEKWTPLMLASFGAYPNVVRQLLDAGANVNAVNNPGQTALIAAMNGAWLRSDWDRTAKRSQETQDTIRLLIERGANVNVSGPDQQTPLDMARESRLHKIAALLREAGGTSTGLQR